MLADGDEFEGSGAHRGLGFITGRMAYWHMLLLLVLLLLELLLHDGRQRLQAARAGSVACSGWRY
jgi:hypothetical protein